MARVKLSEFRAKSILVDDYQGVSLRIETLDQDVAKLDDSKKHVIKVDQGVKKRGKQGLLKLNVVKADAKQAVQELADKGYSRFIAEEMLPHEDSEEHYLSLERTREGIKVTYSPDGGVDVEDNPDNMRSFIYEEDLEDIDDQTPLNPEMIVGIVDAMNEQHLSFVEINPLVIQGDKATLLDASSSCR